MPDWTAEEERVARAIVEAASGPFNVLSVRGKEAAIREARAAIASMSSWRDVKTDPPPRDGWHILARLPDSNTSHTICWTDKAKGIRAELCHDKNPAGWRHAWDGYFFGVGEQPTHWMPLPSAPENHDEGR